MLLFHYHQAMVYPQGSLQGGIDIRPVNLECISVICYHDHLARSFLVLIMNPVLVSRPMLAQVLFFRNSMLKILIILVNSLRILEALIFPDTAFLSGACFL